MGMFFTNLLLIGSFKNLIRYLPLRTFEPITIGRNEWICLFWRYEHETELLREQLRQREQDRERQKRSWEMAERAADERRDSERAQLLRQEEELAQRMRQQDDELRRRQQENTLFVQVLLSSSTPPSLTMFIAATLHHVLPKLYFKV